MTKDWSLHSGERQTPSDLNQIRGDHLNRYRFGLKHLHRMFPNRFDLLGVDVFCGNGYGCAEIVQYGHKVVGLDGSKEAIEFAKTHYSYPPDNEFHHFEWYGQAIGSPRSYDFAFSLESVEHVADGPKFLNSIAKCVKPGGLVVWSTPNEELLPYRENIHVHHVRHYTLAEALDMSERSGLDVIEVGYQTVYSVNAGGVQKVAYPDADVTNKPGQFMILACVKR